jgi:DNA/RNA-binding domain of Phe-tRNA-synthetase-like protein
MIAQFPEHATYIGKLVKDMTREELLEALASITQELKLCYKGMTRDQARQVAEKIILVPR